MATRQISFAIEGMFCAKCAVQIEGTLAHLDGIAAAHVNYATQRASVVYEPTRVLPAAMVRAVHQQGFNVPLEQIRFDVGDLLYASSARTVNRVLSRLDRVVHASIDLANRQIALDVFPNGADREAYARAINALGFQVDGANANSMREFGLRAALIAGLALVSLLSAGAHAGLYALDLIHAPLATMLISTLVIYGFGWKFYRVAYDALLRREVDASVLVAVSASAFLFVGLPLAIIAPTSWLTETGFVLTTLFTAGWFLARGATVWLRWRSTDSLRSVQPAGPFGIVYRGIRR